MWTHSPSRSKTDVITILSTFVRGCFVFLGSENILISHVIVLLPRIEKPSIPDYEKITHELAVWYSMWYVPLHRIFPFIYEP